MTDLFADDAEMIVGDRTVRGKAAIGRWIRDELGTGTQGIAPGEVRTLLPFSPVVNLGADGAHGESSLARARNARRSRQGRALGWAASTRTTTRSRATCGRSRGCDYYATVRERMRRRLTQRRGGPEGRADALHARHGGHFHPGAAGARAGLRCGRARDRATRPAVGDARGECCPEPAEHLRLLRRPANVGRRGRPVRARCDARHRGPRSVERREEHPPRTRTRRTWRAFPPASSTSTCSSRLSSR